MTLPESRQPAAGSRAAGSRAARGRATNPRAAVRVPRATADRLRTGWAGPRGTRVRLARPGDLEQVSRLVPLAGLRLDPAVTAVIEAGTAASILLLGLDDGVDALRDRLAEAAVLDRPEEAMDGLVLMLVATDRDGVVRGVLQALPPTNILIDGVQGGIPLLTAMVGAAKVAKIRVVAVAEDARGRGIGAMVIRRSLQLYSQLGFLLVYGQFAIGSGLETYYDRQGFTVLDEGQLIDLRPIGLNIMVSTDPSDPERLFTRWL